MNPKRRRRLRAQRFFGHSLTGMPVAERVCRSSALDAQAPAWCCGCDRGEPLSRVVDRGWRMVTCADGEARWLCRPCRYAPE